MSHASRMLRNLRQTCSCSNLWELGIRRSGIVRDTEKKSDWAGNDWDWANDDKDPAADSDEKDPAPDADEKDFHLAPCRFVQKALRWNSMF